MNRFLFWFESLRAYALPMSIMAWAIPFSAGYLNNGNIFYGLLSLLGIICVHLGANLFDDIIDYKNFLKNKEENNFINLKKGKCKHFLSGDLSINKALMVVFSLFAIASLVGIFFISIYKLPIILLMLVTGMLCLVYPKSGHIGLSEVIIGLIYAPLLFTGVYYVMTGAFSSKLEWISISFALVTICLLYTDFFLDYNSDKNNGKKTIPILSGSKRNAYNIYMFIIFLIYSNIFLGIHAHIFSTKYLIIFLSVFYAMKTLGNLQNFVDKEIKDEKEFLVTMNDVQKFIAIFTVCTVVALVVS